MRQKRSFAFGAGFPRGVNRDVDDELAFHFESRIAELVRGGMSDDEARRVASAEFGDVREVRDALMASSRRRAARRSRLEALGELVTDLRYVARSAFRTPGFALTAALTLGLGIGAAATMYGVVERLLLRGPEHVASPRSLRRIYVHVRSKASGDFTMSYVGYSMLTTIRDHARSVTGAAAYNVNDGRVGRGIDATIVRVGSATANFFPLLGVHPARGRFFTAAEDAPPDGAPVAVLGEDYSVRELGGIDSVVGRTIVINDKPFTIIGVAPSGFTGAELKPVDVWIPVSAGAHPTADWPTTWQAQWLNVVARLKPGLTAKQIDDDLTSAYRASYTGTDEEWKLADLSARPIAFTPRGKEPAEASIARWLTAVALIVLIIAAANVANLLIVRAIRRHYESAVRLALGISRGRLMRLLVLEGLTYAVLGGVAGVVIAYAGGELMRRVFLPSILWTAPPVSGHVLLLAAGLTLAVGALTGLAPMAQVLGTDVAASLRGATTTQSVRSSRVRRLLVAVQTALSVTLLVGAGLFMRSLFNVRHLDLGLQPDRVLVANVGWPRLENPTSRVAAAEKVRQSNVWRELRERIAHVPGVEHAALAVGSPFGNGFGVDVKVPGRDTLPAAPGGGPYVAAVGADYFAAVGTPLVRGRVFGAGDNALSPRVAIVNQTMATLVWPSEDPLGKCIIVNDAGCYTIVGVVHDARRDAIEEPPSMQYYIPFGQETGFGGTVLLVRPSGEAAHFQEPLRRAIAAAVRDANVVRITPMQRLVDPQVRPWRLGAAMFGSFGAVALIVAAIGLYSAIAYSTAQRAHEFGVRLAIGSTGGRLMRGVLYQGMRSAVIGLLFGAAIAFVAGGKIAPLLFHVSPRDPAVFLGVALSLIVVAVAASVVPAWRAARTDPVVALRSS